MEVLKPGNDGAIDIITIEYDGKDSVLKKLKLK